MADRSSAGNFYTRWSKRRRATREARHLIREARRILRKYSYRIEEKTADEVRHAIDELRRAQESGQLSGIRDKLERLDTLVDKHLAFGRKSVVREYAESIGVAVLVALLLRAFVVEAFKIPSGSMIPTLAVGDHIFVNKFIYGLRIPWTELKYLEVRHPKRGEVIVFIYPKDPSKDFIKRIVAVGGDTIAVRDNVIYLNDKPVKRRLLDGPCSYADVVEGNEEHWMVKPCEAFEEVLDGVQYRVLQEKYSGTPDFPAKKIPPGHVFVMGDNRDNSQDSRYWGTVDEKQIKGKAMIIWYSRGVPDGIRWSRFFHTVHGISPKNPPFVKP